MNREYVIFVTNLISSCDVAISATKKIGVCPCQGRVTLWC